MFIDDDFYRQWAEGDIEKLGGASEFSKAGCLLFLAYGALIVVFLLTAYGIYNAGSGSFTESFFIELNAVILFFLLIPPVLTYANKPGLKLEIFLLAVAIGFLIIARFSDGAWQSILLELGIAILALTGLELVFNRFLIAMKEKQKEAIEMMKNKPYER